MSLIHFQNIRLLPKKCVVQSRTECDTTVVLNQMKFRLPIVPANMTSVLTADLALSLARRGYFYIMHRFRIDNLAFVQRCMKANLVASISVGIKQEDYLLVEQLQKLQLAPHFITIDVAHGHSHRVRDMMFFIKKKLPQSFLIVGNIATNLAAEDLTKWGADMLKVGIGPGSVCVTKNKTGFGTDGWQLSALKAITAVTTLPIIIDGGLSEPGDIAKSLRFGATLCMLGRMLAGFIESPGQLVVRDEVYYKTYFGSASIFNKNTNINIEGTDELLPLKGSIWSYLFTLEQNIKSSISYAGGTNLQALRTVNYVVIS